MKSHYEIQITVYRSNPSYKNQRQNNVQWLQAMIPVIMKTQTMITDELYLAPLGQGVSLCLS
jgi:hypothetical protein